MKTGKLRSFTQAANLTGFNNRSGLTVLHRLGSNAVKIAFPIFFGFAAMSGLTSCSDNDLQEVENITNRGVPAEVSTDVEIIYSDSGQITARLTAKEMVRTLSKEDPIIEMKNGLQALFYGPELKEKSRLRANHGIRFLNTSVTRVDGDVQVVNLKGDTLNGEELFWDENKKMVYSKKFVKVKTKDEIILSEGFESDLNFENVSFFNVRGRVPVNQ